MDIEDYKNYPIFEGLSNDEIAGLLSAGHIKLYNKGQILVQQGDMPQSLYFIVSGSLITFRSSQEGAINAIRLLGKGETCMDAVIFMN